MAQLALLWPCFDRSFHNASRELIQVVIVAQKPEIALEGTATIVSG